MAKSKNKTETETVYVVAAGHALCGGGRTYAEGETITVDAFYGNDANFKAAISSGLISESTETTESGSGDSDTGTGDSGTSTGDSGTGTGDSGTGGTDTGAEK